MRSRTRQERAEEDLSYITRCDYERTHAWWVRIYRSACYSKYFADSVWGSREKALKAARAWRNLKLKELGPPARPPQVPVGYGYVVRQMLHRRVGQYPACLAWIRLENRKAASTNYSIRVWGEDGAREKCERWLARKRKELKVTAVASRAPKAEHSKKASPVASKRAVSKSASPSKKPGRHVSPRRETPTRVYSDRVLKLLSTLRI